MRSCLWLTGGQASMSAIADGASCSVEIGHVCNDTPGLLNKDPSVFGRFGTACSALAEWLRLILVRDCYLQAIHFGTKQDLA